MTTLARFTGNILLLCRARSHYQWYASALLVAASLGRPGHYHGFPVTRHTSSRCPSCYRHISVLAILCSSSLQLSVRGFQQAWLLPAWSVSKAFQTSVPGKFLLIRSWFPLPKSLTFLMSSGPVFLWSI